MSQKNKVEKMNFNQQILEMMRSRKERAELEAQMAKTEYEVVSKVLGDDSCEP